MAQRHYFSDALSEGVDLSMDRRRRHRTFMFEGFTGARAARCDKPFQATDGDLHISCTAATPLRVALHWNSPLSSPP